MNQSYQITSKQKFKPRQELRQKTWILTTVPADNVVRAAHHSHNPMKATSLLPSLSPQDPCTAPKDTKEDVSLRKFP